MCLYRNRSFVALETWRKQRGSMDNKLWLAMADLLRGYQKTQIGCAVASLSIADHLAARPLSLEALVEKTGANPDGLRRLLRGAASLGLVRAESDDLFASTPMLETLRSDAPASLRAVAIMQGSPNHWRPWGRLIDAVRTGQAQAVAALGLPAFDYLAANPDEASFFAKAMQSTSEFVQAEVVRLLDTNGVATAADIGGANGALVCALIAANPTLRELYSTSRMRSTARPRSSRRRGSGTESRRSVATSLSPFRPPASICSSSSCTTGMTRPALRY